MIKTIKLPYSSEYDFNTLLKSYSSTVRWSYNRIKEDKSQKEIRLLSKSLKNIDLLSAWIVQCAISEAQSIHNKVLTSENPDEKVIFGGKKNFTRRIKGFINNSKLKDHRLLPISIQGEMLQKGNRSFKLDILNNIIVFKLNKNEHIELKIPKLRKNYLNELYKLEELNNIKSKEKGYTYSVKIDKNNIYISFENIETVKHILKNDRYIGIDLNPNDIGISISENGKILEVRRYILNINSNNHNKVKHEILEISKNIFLLFKSYNCKFMFVEDLTIKSKDHNKGKTFNKNINNKWIRNGFINNLEKRIGILKGKVFKINPAYTSFIGNIIHDFDDSINASLEIARRGYEVIILKNKKFYPDINLSSIKDQWKEHLVDGINTWKDFFDKIKNLKLKYRVSSGNEVFSHLSDKSNIGYYYYRL